MGVGRLEEWRGAGSSFNNFGLGECARQGGSPKARGVRGGWDGVNADNTESAKRQGLLLE